MLLTNHALTGILLGLTIDNPALLVPAGIGSHLVMDALPHSGAGPVGSPLFITIGTMDTLGAIGVTSAACVAWPHRTGHILIGAFSAVLPDLIYIPETIFGLKRLEKNVPGYRAVRHFTGGSEFGGIQWYQEPPGLIVEAAWAGLMMWLLSLRLP